MKISLRQARIGKGLTQSKAAKALGVHQNTIATWERKPYTVPAGKAVELLMLYEVKFDDIIFLP